MVWPSLKELFTFTPDPQGEEIGSIANAVVANYTLLEKETHKHRAEICRCGGCKQDFKDAQDRQNWVFLEERWRIKHPNEVRIRVKKNGT